MNIALEEANKLQARIDELTDKVRREAEAVEGESGV
jgi:hypothetical protein